MGDQPSTSRGGSSGLLRLVVPDSDSEAEVGSPGSPRLEIDVTGTEPAKMVAQETRKEKNDVSDDLKEAQWGVVVEEAPASQDWMRMLSAPATSSSHPGYYSTSSYPPSVSDISGLNFLSDVVSFQRALETPPMEDARQESSRDKNRKKAEEENQKQEEEEDNSDLEVVDVVRAKPRKPREVTVVELSSSEDEPASEVPLHHQLDLSGFIPLQSGSANKPQDFDPNEPIMILSSDEEEELLQTVTPTSYTAPPAMRMQLNTLMHRKPAAVEQQQEESSSEDDLIVVKTEHCTIDPITKKQITEPVRNKKCNHIYEKATIYSMIEQARAAQKSVRCPYGMQPEGLQED